MATISFPESNPPFCSSITMQKRKSKVTVIGIGNTLMRDDGVGIEVIELLKQSRLPSDVVVDIIDGGLAPDLSVMIEEGIDKLVIIDAIQAGGTSGTVYHFTADVLEKSAHSGSPHNLGLKQSLALMKVIGILPPETIIIGVEPADMGFGNGLTPGVRAALPQIVEAVQKEIRLG